MIQARVRTHSHTDTCAGTSSLFGHWEETCIKIFRCKTRLVALARFLPHVIFPAQHSVLLNNSGILYSYEINVAQAELISHLRGFVTRLQLSQSLHYCQRILWFTYLHTMYTNTHIMSQITELSICILHSGLVIQDAKFSSLDAIHFLDLFAINLFYAKIIFYY